MQEIVLACSCHPVQIHRLVNVLVPALNEAAEVL